MLLICGELSRAYSNKQGYGDEGALPARQVRQVSLPAVAAASIAVVAPLKLHAFSHLHTSSLIAQHDQQAAMAALTRKWTGDFHVLPI